MSNIPLPRKLYLRLSDSHLCFARYEMRRDAVFHFVSWEMRPRTSLTVNLREAHDAEPIVQAPADRIEVIASCPVTPVPLADFQEEDCERIYNYCFQDDSQPRRVFYDTLPGAGAVLLYAVPEATCEAVESVLGDVHYTAALTHVLRHFADKAPMVSIPNVEQGSKRLFAYLHGSCTDLAVFDGGRLLIVNSFETHEATDVAYFALNMAQKLGVSAERDAFYVAGAAELREPAVQELRRFVRNVYNTNPTGEFNRHVVSTTPGVPYDLMTALIG